MERLLLTVVVGGLTTLVLLLLDRRSRRRAARALVAESAGAPALVVFRSATCGRCDAQMRQIAALDDVAVRVVDVEWAPETARRFGVMSLPSTVVSSPAGRVVAVNHGFASTAQLAAQLDTARDTDLDRPRPPPPGSWSSQPGTRVGPMPREPHLTAKLQGFGTTIFAEMSALAVRHGAVNLGQGFPDFDPPVELTEAACAAITAGRNQYAPGIGIPALRQAVADQGRRLWGLEHDPDTEVTITTGATEAVFATLQGLLDVGDEVVVFEPSYDSYTASIAMAGAVPRPVPLRPDPASGRWVFDLEDLRVAVGPRTRLILLNSPHNPTGKVFDRQELAQIAAVALEHDLVVVTDEVYEHLTFDVDHVPMASLPGMWERTVRISSAGKSYSVTGWKVGWVCAPAPLTAAVRAAKQFVTFTSGTPFQHAVAVAVQWGEEYLGPYRKGYAARRQLLCDGLREAGWDVIAPEGTYFAVADLRSVGITDRDIDFCRRAPSEHGVAAVPVSVFCQDPRATAHLIRLAFCKTDDVIAEGVRRLKELVVR